MRRSVLGLLIVCACTAQQPNEDAKKPEPQRPKSEQRAPTQPWGITEPGKECKPLSWPGSGEFTDALRALRLNNDLSALAKAKKLYVQFSPLILPEEAAVPREVGERWELVCPEDADLAMFVRPFAVGTTGGTPLGNQFAVLVFDKNDKRVWRAGINADTTRYVWDFFMRETRKGDKQLQKENK